MAWLLMFAELSRGGSTAGRSACAATRAPSRQRSQQKTGSGRKVSTNRVKSPTTGPNATARQIARWNLWAKSLEPATGIEPVTCCLQNPGASSWPRSGDDPHCPWFPYSAPRGHAAWLYEMAIRAPGARRHRGVLAWKFAGLPIQLDSSCPGFVPRRLVAFTGFPATPSPRPPTR